MILRPARGVARGLRNHYRHPPFQGLQLGASWLPTATAVVPTRYNPALPPQVVGWSRGLKAVTVCIVVKPPGGNPGSCGCHLLELGVGQLLARLDPGVEWQHEVAVGRSLLQHVNLQV